LQKLDAIEGWTLILAQIPKQFQQAIGERLDFSQPPEVYDFAIEEATKSNDREAKRLADAGFFEKVILTEGVILSKEADSLYTVLSNTIANYDLRIMTAVTNSQRVWPEEVSEWEMNRVLNVFPASVPNLDRLNIILQRFARAPQASVRSRAVRLIGQAFRQEPWFEKMMRDPDARVRSNVLEVIGELKDLTPFFKSLVVKATEDRHHRVQTTAYFVLAKYGDTAAAARIVELLEHRNESFRKAARWALRALAAAKLRSKQAEEIVVPGYAPSADTSETAAAGEPLTDPDQLAAAQAEPAGVEAA
jgi:HEAT repeat protein